MGTQTTSRPSAASSHQDNGHLDGQNGTSESRSNGRSSSGLPRFIPVPQEICHWDLPAHAKLIYGLLCMHSQNEERIAFPSQDYIADFFGIGVRSVRDHLKTLESQGLISINQRGKKQSNIYKVHQLIPRAKKNQNTKGKKSSGHSDRKKTAGSDRKNASAPQDKKSSIRQVREEENENENDGCAASSPGNHSKPSEERILESPEKQILDLLGQILESQEDAEKMLKVDFNYLERTYPDKICLAQTVCYYNKAKDNPEKIELLRLWAGYIRGFEKENKKLPDKTVHLEKFSKNGKQSVRLPISSFQEFKKELEARVGKKTLVQDFWDNYCEWYLSGEAIDDGVKPEFQSLKNLLDIKTLQKFGIDNIEDVSKEKRKKTEKEKEASDIANRSRALLKNPHVDKSDKKKLKETLTQYRERAVILEAVREEVMRIEGILFKFSL